MVKWKSIAAAASGSASGRVVTASVMVVWVVTDFLVVHFSQVGALS